MRREILRTVTFRPYVSGPTFKLQIWDTGHVKGRHELLGYELTMREHNVNTRIFRGEDFGASPLHPIDSDDVVRAIMTFLTLRPGDTDREYFDDYTPEQMDFANQHAEALGAEALARFGDE